MLTVLTVKTFPSYGHVTHINSFNILYSAFCETHIHYREKKTQHPQNTIEAHVAWWCHIRSNLQSCCTLCVKETVNMWYLSNVTMIFFLAVCERLLSWHLSLSRDQWCWLGFVSPIYHYRLSIIVYVRVYMVLTGSCYAETTPWFYSDDILDRLAAVDYICQKSTFPFPSK